MALASALFGNALGQMYKAKDDQTAAKLDALQATGKSGNQQFTAGDMASQEDSKYGTLGQVPPDVLMARYSQHTGEPMGSGGNASYAQRGRDLQSMAKQYKSLTTKVSTLNPWGDYKNWSGGNKRGGFFKTGTKKKDKWKRRSQNWMSQKGNEMAATRKDFFGQNW